MGTPGGELFEYKVTLEDENGIEFVEYVYGYDEWSAEAEVNRLKEDTDEIVDLVRNS